MPYELTEEQRDRYRAIATRSRQRKETLLRHHLNKPPKSPLGGERLDPLDLMPQLELNGLTCLSLFSGGGGLDFGFERAGFEHVASFELLDVCGETLRGNRPYWDVRSGSDNGDVTNARFTQFRGVDVVHGGPPCQPFSIAGKQAGADDPRNMWGDFVRCVLQTRPRAFIAENVPGLLDKKFESFVQQVIIDPLAENYTIFKFRLAAHDFGVPQARRRVFFVGFRAARDAARFQEPQPTHGDVGGLFGPLLPRNTARKSLGLPNIGYDVVAPTLRSGFTGPRNTTGVLNSKAALKVWNDLKIWPNGVQQSHTMACAFPPENGHFRLSVADCAILQGFPEQWKFAGAVYQALGQIGNSVCPPVAFAVAQEVAKALGAGQ
ncbi:DNA cytosine methyltransferase [Burkholderia diffusa]|uniref:DNA cytosine methyltransferase n=1 Tax=Burkholderia diffusa TaxID=488732 RepID=UPI00157BB58C|nr:DNA (cytosine-5-)-methyltransferase [Burkholderia diffusa]NTY39136.1 DNA cytosine methyltransferase [Burkholderia diffusa]